MLAEVAIEWQASCLRIMPSCPNNYQNLGKVGKKNQKKILAYSLLSHRPTCWLLCLLLVGGCRGGLSDALQSGGVLPWNGLEGRWVERLRRRLPRAAPRRRG